MLIDSADVLRSIGIELDATSSTCRTSMSDAVPVTALGHTHSKMCLSRPPACDVRLGSRVPCPLMVSCMHRADVTEASAASESAVPPNSKLSKFSPNYFADGRDACLVVTLSARLTTLQRGNRLSAPSTRTRHPIEYLLRWAARADHVQSPQSSRL